MRRFLALLAIGSALAPGLRSADGNISIPICVDMDQILADSNSSDPVIRDEARKAMERVMKANPSGIRHMAGGGAGLDVPSWSWRSMRVPEIRGVNIARSATDGTLAGAMVDLLPGRSDHILQDVVGTGAVTSTTSITQLGRFKGTGTRVVSLQPGQVRSECVLFYPSGKLAGYYIFTMYAGPDKVGAPEAELATVVDSMRRE